MVLRIRPLINRRAWMWLVTSILVCGVGFAGETGENPTTAEGETVFPVDEKLLYSISWMGVHCGHMEIGSFVENGPDGEPMYRITVLTRTTKFFDGIHRVRSRLDSFFDPRLMSSVRYEEHSVEKKKRKDETWLVDLEAKEVVRTKNGETTSIPVEVDRAYDPLAFIFRLRTMDTEVGEEITLGLMTSKGAVETVVRATEHKRVRTKMGKCDAVAVIPEPRDEMMFSKSGSMVVWIDRSEPKRPCKIEFDLSFGKLVASLKETGPAPADDFGADWEHWGDRQKESR